MGVKHLLWDTIGHSDGQEGQATIDVCVRQVVEAMGTIKEIM